MSPLEELEAANLTRSQKNYFLGYIGEVLDHHGVIIPANWSAALKYAKEWTA